MSESKYVLDASAILAALFKEPGVDKIAPRIEGAFVSAVNYHEVIAKLVDRGSPAEAVIVMMQDLGLDCVALDRAQAERAGLLRGATRDAGLSLGDRACLALAATKGAIALTTDRAWAELDIGVSVELAR